MSTGPYPQPQPFKDPTFRKGFMDEIDIYAFESTHCQPQRSQQSIGSGGDWKTYPVKMRADEVAQYPGWPCVVLNLAAQDGDPEKGHPTCNFLHPANSGFLDIFYKQGIGYSPGTMYNPLYYPRESGTPRSTWGGAQLTQGNSTLFLTGRNFDPKATGMPLAVLGRYQEGILLDENCSASGNSSDLSEVFGSILEVGIIEASFVRINASLMSTKIYSDIGCSIINTALFPSLIESKLMVSAQLSQIEAEIISPFIFLHSLTMLQDSVVEAEEFLKIQGAEAFKSEVELTGPDEDIPEYTAKTLYADEGYYAITTSELLAPVINIDSSSFSDCSIECNESLFSTSDFLDCSIALEPGGTGEFDEEHPNPNPTGELSEENNYTPLDLYSVGPRHKAKYGLSTTLSNMHGDLSDLYKKDPEQTDAAWESGRTRHTYNVRSCNQNFVQYSFFPSDHPFNYDENGNFKSYDDMPKWIESCSPVVSQEPNQIRYDAATMVGRLVHEDTLLTGPNCHFTTHAIEDCKFINSSIVVPSGYLYMKACTFDGTTLQLDKLSTKNNSIFRSSGVLIVESVLEALCKVINGRNFCYAVEIKMEAGSLANIASMHGEIKLNLKSDSETILHQSELRVPTEDGFIVAESGASVKFEQGLVTICDSPGYSKYGGDFIFSNVECVKKKAGTGAFRTKSGFTLELSGTLKAENMSGGYLENNGFIDIRDSLRMSSDINNYPNATLDCSNIELSASLVNQGSIKCTSIIGNGKDETSQRKGAMHTTSLNLTFFNSDEESSIKAESMIVKGGSMRGSVDTTTLDMSSASLGNSSGDIGSLRADTSIIWSSGDSIGTAILWNSTSYTDFVKLGTDVTFAYSNNIGGNVANGLFLASNSGPVLGTDFKGDTIYVQSKLINCNFKMAGNSITAETQGNSSFNRVTPTTQFPEGFGSNPSPVGRRDRPLNNIELTQTTAGNISIKDDFIKNRLPSSYGYIEIAPAVDGSFSDIGFLNSYYDADEEKFVSVYSTIPTLTIDIGTAEGPGSIFGTAHLLGTNNLAPDNSDLVESEIVVTNRASIAGHNVTINHFDADDGFGLTAVNATMKNCNLKGSIITCETFSMTNVFVVGGSISATKSNTFLNCGINNGEVFNGTSTIDVWPRSFPKAFVGYSWRETIPFRNALGQRDSRTVRQGVFFDDVFATYTDSQAKQNSLAAQVKLKFGATHNGGILIGQRISDIANSTLTKAVSYDGSSIHDSTVDSATFEATQNPSTAFNHESRFSNCEIFNTQFRGMSRLENCVLTDCSSTSPRLQITQSAIKGSLSISNATSNFTSNGSFTPCFDLIGSTNLGTINIAGGGGGSNFAYFQNVKNQREINAEGVGVGFFSSTNSSTMSIDEHTLSFWNSTNFGDINARSVLWGSSSINNGTIQAEFFYAGLSNIGSKLLEYTTSNWQNADGSAGGPVVSLNVGDSGYSEWNEKGFSFDIGPGPQYQGQSFNSSNYTASSTSNCLSPAIDVTVSNEYYFNGKRTINQTFKINRNQYTFRNIPDTQPIGFFGQSDETFTYFGEKYAGSRIVDGKPVKYYSGDVLLHISQGFTGLLNFNSYNDSTGYLGSIQYDTSEECGTNLPNSFAFMDNPDGSTNTSTTHSNGQLFGMRGIPSNYAIRIFAPADHPTSPHAIIDFIFPSSLESQTFQGYILEQIIVPAILDGIEPGKSNNLPTPVMKIGGQCQFASIYN